MTCVNVVSQNAVERFIDSRIYLNILWKNIENGHYLRLG